MESSLLTDGDESHGNPIKDAVRNNIMENLREHENSLKHAMDKQMREI
jgi:hypothetical protein